MNLQVANATVTIRAGERSRTIVAGQTVDLDDVIVPVSGQKAALTLGQCVNPDHFTAAERPTSPARRRRADAPVPADIPAAEESQS